MLPKVRMALELYKNMGAKYILYRLSYALKKKLGFLKMKFPINPEVKSLGTLENWKQQRGLFFFLDKSEIKAAKNPSQQLFEWFENYKTGRIIYFDSITFDLGSNYDWVTNPETGYKYDINLHWTEINDFSSNVGDIKYVWEKSRFSFLYSIIRYDYHFGKDCSEIVFNEILSWIAANPINQGPNYFCSQEISIRLMNWTFALYYYKDAVVLNEEVFKKIGYSYYWQLHHVYTNINFSRIAVRNNHAITECLMLYLGGLLFPYIKNFTLWGKKGKCWFEEEIKYQIYSDGTFLQFSMNYHRVVIQLLTWGIQLSTLNRDKLSDVILDRAEKSLFFLRVCMNESDGFLPNYGANDGALFFKLNQSHYRDFRPQLSALAKVLKIDIKIREDYEDLIWYRLESSQNIKSFDLSNLCYEFPVGGYYLTRELNSLTFIRCGNHKDRPSQADNLHIDIWYNGENILLDAGSYKYNTDLKQIKYFSGTESHNTVMLNDFEQMKKGSRFTWFNWTQKESASLKILNDEVLFDGTITAFQYLDKNIKHNRKFTKKIGKGEWIISDFIINKPQNLSMRQIWHMPFNYKLVFSSYERGKSSLNKIEKLGYASSLYGLKEKTRQIEYTSTHNYIETYIKIKQ